MKMYKNDFYFATFHAIKKNTSPEKFAEIERVLENFHKNPFEVLIINLSGKEWPLKAELS